MFDFPLGKHWLGPTNYYWRDNQCKNLSSPSEEADLGKCKQQCEKTVGCNAIAFKDPFSDNPCMLKDCDFPVPAPMGRPVCDDEECGGYYRATGTNPNKHL